MEISESISLLALLENFDLSKEVDDRCWDDGIAPFSCKLVYKTMLDKKRLDFQLGCLDFPWERIWKSKLVPPKVAFFTWTLLRGRVLTIDKLKHRGLQLVNRCCFCKHDEESATHLFEVCPVVKKICDWFWVNVDSTENLGDTLLGKLQQKGGIRLSRLGNLHWDLTFFAVNWTVWLENNRRLFDSKEWTFTQITCDVREFVWQWALLEEEGMKICIDSIMCEWDSLMLS